MLRIDNAPELIRGPFEAFTKANGITYEKITPEASPQNGVAERANLTVASMTRCMLIDGDMSDFFWPLAAQAAIHIKNLVPHSALSPDVTPHELWFKRKANLSHLRPFGCLVTSRKMNADALGKFEPRGEQGRFVGYARDASGYLIWFPDSKAVRVRRDVKFHEMPDITTPRSDRSSLWDNIPGMQIEQRFRGLQPDELAPAEMSHDGAVPMELDSIPDKGLDPVSKGLDPVPVKELDSVSKGLDPVPTEELDSVPKGLDPVPSELRLSTRLI